MNIDEGHLGGYIKSSSTPAISGLNIEHGDPVTYSPELWQWCIDELDVNSVLDVGCGEGHAALYFQNNGCHVQGVDGSREAFLCSKIQRNHVTIDYSLGTYQPHNFDPPETFDLVWCSEFVEHVEERFSDNFLKTFQAANKYLLITYAKPGQPGWHHVNCQTKDYWISKIEPYGFRYDQELTQRCKEKSDKTYFGSQGLAFIRCEEASSKKAHSNKTASNENNQKSTTKTTNYWQDKSVRYNLAKHAPHRYLTFDIDQGGLNNIRIAFEYAVVIAAITGRTLVIPPPRPWYLINIGPIDGGQPGGETYLGDVFDLHALSQAIPIISTEKFIEQASEHLAIPTEFHSYTLQQNNTKLSDVHKEWSDWLFASSTNIPWNPYDTLVCTPSIEAANAAVPLPEYYVDGRNLVEFSPWMKASPVLHLPSNHEYRSLGPVATMLASDKPELPTMARRLLKNNVRYRTEMFQIANQLIAAIGFQQFNAMHVRRNDFQYKQTRLNAEEILQNVSPLFDSSLPLYIATDETSKEFNQVFSQGRKVFLWQDVCDAANLDIEIPIAWVGTIEQLICVAAKEFAGTDLSTFSTYIHRLRGYINGPDTQCYYHSVDNHDHDSKGSTGEFRGRNYLQENPLFWLDC